MCDARLMLWTRGNTSLASGVEILFPLQATQIMKHTEGITLFYCLLSWKCLEAIASYRLALTQYEKQPSTCVVSITSCQRAESVKVPITNKTAIPPKNSRPNLFYRKLYACFFLEERTTAPKPFSRRVDPTPATDDESETGEGQK
jgi:hypothetical protein